jgi:DNA processing protein
LTGADISCHLRDVGKSTQAMTETEACIALNMVPRMGPVRLRKLLEVFGDPASILRAPMDRLAGVSGVGPELARLISSWEEHVDLMAELALIAEAGVQVLTAAAENYPALLRTIHDPPIVLYVRGELKAIDARAIGVVGSRQTTYYGLETAKKLSYQLAYAGLTIFSGLARGIDTAAHQGALAAKGRTVAVLGCGLGQVYPPENFELAEKIAAGAGAVISEFAMSVRPDRQTFPMRNRIISGCSLGLLVIEAGVHSGALISAAQAGEQGRSVFAVPGPIDRPSSYGTNRLIQQGAKLVMDSSDILEELAELPGFGPLPRREPETEAEAVKPGPRDEKTGAAAGQQLLLLKSAEEAILAAVERDETPIDRIILKCGLPTSVVSSTLFALELKKLVKQLPGKNYVRLAWS